MMRDLLEVEVYRPHTHQNQNNPWLPTELLCDFNAPSKPGSMTVTVRSAAGGYGDYFRMAQLSLPVDPSCAATACKR